jgi:alanine-synthesizing transaminase
MLASMRLCANVPAMYAIQTALGGRQTIEDLVTPGGLFHQQRDLAWERLNAMPGVSCVRPLGALYLFPRLDPEIYPIADDEQFVLDLLLQEKLLLVQGTAFNWFDTQHFRIVFLPKIDELNNAMDRLAHFLERLRAG